MTDKFDHDMKAKIKDEPYHMPESLQVKIDDTLANLPTKSRKNRKKVIIWSAAPAVFALSMATFQLDPSLARNIGIPNSLIEKLSLGSDFEKVSVNTNEVQESNGVKISITNAIFDGYYLLVSYKAESEKPFTQIPRLFPNETKIVADEKEAYISPTNEEGEYLDNHKKIYNGLVVFPMNEGSNPLAEKSNDNSANRLVEENQINISNLPEEFGLEMNIDELGMGEEKGIKGEWKFSLQVKTQKAKNNSSTLDIKKSLPKLGPNVMVEKVIVTPIRIYLQGLQNEESGILDYLIEDEQGERKNWLSSSIGVGENGTERMLSTFENKNPLLNSLKIIPYIYHKEVELTADNSTEFQPTEETKLPISKDHFVTITHVEVKDGKTYLSYKSDVPVNEYMPFIIKDSNGKEYMRNLNDNVPSTADSDAIAVMDGNLLDGKFTIYSPNTYYYNQAFTVELK